MNGHHNTKKIYGATKTSDFIHFEDFTKQIQIPDGHKHGTIIQVPLTIVENLKEQKE